MFLYKCGKRYGMQNSVLFHNDTLPFKPICKSGKLLVINSQTGD